MCKYINSYIIKYNINIIKLNILEIIKSMHKEIKMTSNECINKTKNEIKINAWA